MKIAFNSKGIKSIKQTFSKNKKKKKKKGRIFRNIGKIYFPDREISFALRVRLFVIKIQQV